MRRGPVTGRDGLRPPVVDQPHRPARAARELDGQMALDRRPLLRAEPAAHELAAHHDALGFQAERACQLAPGIVDALGRDPDLEVTLAVPVGDCAVRLERHLHLRRGAVLRLDHDVGACKAGLGVSPLALGRVVREPLLAQRLARVDHERQSVEARGECRDPARRRRRVVGRDGCHRAPGELGLARQQVAPAHARPVPGADRSAHAGDGECGGEVDLHRRVRVRRAQHERVQHPGQRDVRDEARRAADTQRAGQARRRVPDDIENLILAPGIRPVLDESPALLEAALDLDGGLAQAGRSRHAAPSAAARSTARSIPR